MPDPTDPQISYRADLGVLLVRWPTEFTPDGLRAGYEQVLHASQQHTTARWLLDLRRRPALPPEIANWAAHHFLPRAAAVLAPRRLRIAFLIPPQRFELMQQDASLAPSIQEVFETTRAYESQLFGDEGAAVRWLLL